jgi:hypothetical protein
MSLQHELGDVSEESSLADVDFAPADGIEEFREDSVDLGHSFIAGSLSLPARHEASAAWRSAGARWPQRVAWLGEKVMR